MRLSPSAVLPFVLYLRNARRTLLFEIDKVVGSRFQSTLGPFAFLGAGHSALYRFQEFLHLIFRFLTGLLDRQEDAEVTLDLFGDADCRLQWIGAALDDGDQEQIAQQFLQSFSGIPQNVLVAIDLQELLPFAILQEF